MKNFKTLKIILPILSLFLLITVSSAQDRVSAQDRLDVLAGTTNEDFENYKKAIDQSGNQQNNWIPQNHPVKVGNDLIYKNLTVNPSNLSSLNLIHINFQGYRQGLPCEFNLPALNPYPETRQIDVFTEENEPLIGMDYLDGIYAHLQKHHENFRSDIAKEYQPFGIAFPEGKGEQFYIDVFGPRWQNNRMLEEGADEMTFINSIISVRFDPRNAEPEQVKVIDSYQRKRLPYFGRPNINEDNLIWNYGKVPRFENYTGFENYGAKNYGDEYEIVRVDRKIVNLLKDDKGHIKDKGYYKLACEIRRPDGSHLGTPYQYALIITFETIYNRRKDKRTLNQLIIPIVYPGPKQAIDDKVKITGNFVSPIMPTMVLHDPPGDGSSAYFQESVKACSAFELSESANAGGAVGGAIKIGVKGEVSAGFIVTAGTEFEAYAQVSADAEFSLEKFSDSSFEVCQNFTTAYKTNEAGLPGDDLFYGLGLGFLYGEIPSYLVDENNSLIDGKVLVLAPDPENSTTLIQSESYIRNELLKLRQQVETLHRQEHTEHKKKDAQMALVDKFYEQINLWEDALNQNAEAKAKFKSTSNNVALSGGPSMEYSETETTSSSITNGFQASSSLTVGTEFLAEAGGSGVSGYANASIGFSFGNSSTKSQENELEIGYTLYDDDEGDLLTIVRGKDPRYGTPIFRLDSQKSATSIPYEGGRARDQATLKNGDDCPLNDGKVISIANIPTGDKGVQIPVEFCNTSEEDRSYVVWLDRRTNLSGVKFQLGGSDIGASEQGAGFELPGNRCMQNSSALQLKVSNDYEGINRNIRLYVTPADDPDQVLDEIILYLSFTSEKREDIDWCAQDIMNYSNSDLDAEGFVYSTIPINGTTWLLEDIRRTKSCNDSAKDLMEFKNSKSGEIGSKMGYYKEKKNNISYNHLAAANCDVCPEGFRLMEISDFEKAKEYIKDNTAEFGNNPDPLKVLNMAEQDKRYWIYDNWTENNLENHFQYIPTTDDIITNPKGDNAFGYIRCVSVDSN